MSAGEAMPTPFWKAHSWMFQALTLEMRKAVSYRVDFWVQFIGTVAAELGVAFFLWKAIFAAQGAERMGGFTFPEMMLYYFLVPIVTRVTRPMEGGFLAQEIYDGSLNRYLVYPISFFRFKYLSLLAQSLVNSLQLVVALLIFVLAVGVPEGSALSMESVAQGLVAALLAGGLYFTLSSSLELVAFWMEDVWSLQVMLRIFSQFLGGGMVPLSFFPGLAHAFVLALPFHFIISFPVRCMMGQVGGAEWLQGVGLILVWTVAGAGLCQWIWRRGLRRYTGVGI